ncbi:MAG: hypothetical protein QNJ65_07155 [Xenococcaceae cyanobacterium MO_234.B1]|nr:hypothetical protein [Xenococcaceae cyanobacterium MO_234.B1]
MRIGLKSVAQSSSSSQKSHIVPKPFVKGTVQGTPPCDGGACLDSVNLFNPPKSNPNGRLASSRLFNKPTTPKKALSDRGMRSGKGARTEQSALRVTKDKSHKPPVEGSLHYQKSGFTQLRFKRKLPSRPASLAFARRGTSDQKFQETSREILNSWRISAIAIILLANTISAFVILRDKFQTPLVTQDSETTPEILVGKINLTAQEFITPDLNSLSHISLTSQGRRDSAVKQGSFLRLRNNTVEQALKSEVPLPLAIPPTNLPRQEIISSRTVNTSYYYVLTEYTGEQSLRLAQKQVKNVSLVNFPQGIFIYLGAFSDKTVAQQFVNKIKEEGLEGYIYPTDHN